VVAQRLAVHAVHVDHVPGARRFVKGVDVLRDDHHVAAVSGRMLGLEPGKGEVGGVGLCVPTRPAARVVELQHAGRIAGKAFRCGDFAVVDLGPDAVLVAERSDARLGGNAGAGQDDDAFEAGHTA
jgi:hypothetical protein